MAIACQVGVLSLLIGRLRVVIVSFFGFLFCLMGLWAISQQGYLGGVFATVSVADRLGCWNLGLQEIFANPLVGLGFGNNTFRNIYPGDPPGDCKGPHLHNTFLMFAMGSGIPAVIFLFWIFVKGAKALLSGVKISLTCSADAFRIAIALMVVGFWVCGFF